MHSFELGLENGLLLHERDGVRGLLLHLGVAIAHSTAGSVAVLAHCAGIDCHA